MKKDKIKTIQDAIEEEALRRTNLRLDEFRKSLIALTQGTFYNLARHSILSVATENPLYDHDNNGTGIPGELRYLQGETFYSLGELVSKEEFLGPIRTKLYPTYYEEVLEEVKKCLFLHPKPKNYPKGDE